MTEQPRALGWSDRTLLTALGLPAFGIALSYTLVTTFVPVLIERLSGPAVTGLLVGGEGLLSLFVPVLVGTWSDATRSRMGARIPFVLAGASLAVVGLLLIPSSAGSLTGISIGLAVFFVGYFVYHSPYYALFPDLVPADRRGRSQGVQGGFRSVGMLLSLATGGLLLEAWTPLPFVVGAVSVIAVTAVLYVSVRERARRGTRGGRVARGGWTAEWDLLAGSADIRRWAVANSLWEAALGALRVFVVLYFSVGLGLSLVQVSGALALVGLVAVVAAPISGRLADRYGHRPVMLTAVWVFGLGLLPPLVTVNRVFIVAIVPVACAAVVLLTLPYSVLMGLLPERSHHGVGAGLFGFSRGIGVLLGPLTAGFAVRLTRPFEVGAFAQTQGYAAVFAVAGLFLLVSVPVLRRIRMERRAPETG